MSSTPNLIDDQAKMYLDATLQKCHQTRIKVHSIALNIIVFVLFVSIVGGFLYYCYRTKPTKEDVNYKMMKDQEFILSKIRFYQEQQEKINQHSSPITGLPAFSQNDSDYMSSL